MCSGNGFGGVAQGGNNGLSQLVPPLLLFWLVSRAFSDRDNNDNNNDRDGDGDGDDDDDDDDALDDNGNPRRGRHPTTGKKKKKKRSWIKPVGAGLV